MEALEHALALEYGNARPRIRHRQDGVAIRIVDGDIDASAFRRVT